MSPSDHSRTHSSAKHSHSHCHSSHAHSQNQNRNTLILAFALTAGYALVEFIGGWFSGSLALLSDAGHMVADAGALLLALCTHILARKPANARASYGYVRAEVLGAFINALFMLILVLWLGVEAIHRLIAPKPIEGGLVTSIAAIGLLVNLLVAWILSRGEQHFSTRGALLHVLSDLLGSIAAIIAGVLISLTGWLAIDPILSFAISLLILNSTWRLLRETTAVLMETVPKGIPYEKVKAALLALPGVTAVHDLHIWHLGPQKNTLSAHLSIESALHWPQLAQTIEELLVHQFQIQHNTIQPHWPMDPPLEPHSSNPYNCHFQG